MITLRSPSEATIQNFLAKQANLEFTYSEVGATATTPPPGYVVDHTRVKLGEGEKVFAAAWAALGRWEQFRLGWVRARAEEKPIESGDVVAVVARLFGLWWLNACRVVYVVEELGAVHRIGFASGTLPDHAGSGEERFLLEWDRASDVVTYDILAFSRPHQWLARLGYAYMRRVQRRFGRESAAAMVRVVKEGST
jgi:uncharacterized protein (UPF0548 family)